MEKTSVRECKTGSTGEPTVIALNKRNYLRRVFVWALAAGNKCR